MRYLIVHPTRERPEMASKTVLKWIERIGDSDFTYMISMDNSDNSIGATMRYVYDETIDVMKNKKGCDIDFIVSDNRNMVDACNSVLKFTKKIKYDILVLVSDDFDCPEKWGDKLFEFCIKNNLKSESPFMIKTVDLIQDDILTLPILSKGFIDKFGYIYYPEYESMFADTDLYELGFENGIYYKSYLIFEHLHYSVGKSNIDDTYKKENSTDSWVIGEALLNERRKRKFAN